MLVGCWMVGESGIKANSAQFSWSLAELTKNSLKVLFRSGIGFLLTNMTNMREYCHTTFVLFPFKSQSCRDYILNTLLSKIAANIAVSQTQLNH